MSLEGGSLPYSTFVKKLFSCTLLSGKIFPLLLNNGIVLCECHSAVNHVAQECFIPMTVVNVKNLVFLFHSTEAVAEWTVQCDETSDL